MRGKILLLLAAAAGALVVRRRKAATAEPDLWKQATEAADLR